MKRRTFPEKKSGERIFGSLVFSVQRPSFGVGAKRLILCCRHAPFVRSDSVSSVKDSRLFFLGGWDEFLSRATLNSHAEKWAVFLCLHFFLYLPASPLPNVAFQPASVRTEWSQNVQINLAEHNRAVKFKWGRITHPISLFHGHFSFHFTSLPPAGITASSDPLIFAAGDGDDDGVSSGDYGMDGSAPWYLRVQELAHDSLIAATRAQIARDAKANQDARAACVGNGKLTPPPSHKDAHDCIAAFPN